MACSTKYPSAVCRKRIRLYTPYAAVIGKIDAEMVRRGEADDFQSRAGAEEELPIGSTRVRTAISPAPCWMIARCGTAAPLVIHVKISGSASQKSLSGGRTGSWCDSMSDHIASRAWRWGLQRCESGHRDCLVFAFLPEHVQKHRGRWSAVSVPVEVHDVVKIAGPRPFSERPQLFPKASS